MSRALIDVLMDPARADPGFWSPHDLTAMVDHQWRTALLSEREALSQAARLRVDVVDRIVAESGCRVFGDVFDAGLPDGRLLGIVKEYAKSALAADGGLPRDVARVLYVACLVHARRAGVPGVTSLDAASIEREARRCLTFSWLPERVRGHLSSAPSRQGGR